MSDFFTTFVVPDATLEEAPALARVAVDWLVAKGIVLEERTDCVLGDEPGHRPGPNYADALTHDGTNLLETTPNGLDVRIGKEVFHPMGDETHAFCPRCGLIAGDDFDALLERVNEWWEASGPAVHPCGGCGQSIHIADWHWDPMWAFGFLGFKFWNWALFEPEFVRGLSDTLGRPITIVGGRI